MRRSGAQSILSVENTKQRDIIGNGFSEQKQLLQPCALLMIGKISDLRMMSPHNSLLTDMKIQALSRRDSANAISTV